MSTTTDLSRRLGAFVAGSLCGTAGSFGAELTVPGERTVPCAAVTQVTVLPTHRRRGLLGAMMKPQLQDAIDRGELAAMLIAAEWPIYGRYGYGMAIEAAATIVDAEAAEFRDPDLEGSIELVDAATLWPSSRPGRSTAIASRRPARSTASESWWPIHVGVVGARGHGTAEEPRAGSCTAIRPEPSTATRCTTRARSGSTTGRG